MSTNLDSKTSISAESSKKYSGNPVTDFYVTYAKTKKLAQSKREEITQPKSNFFEVDSNDYPKYTSVVDSLENSFNNSYITTTDISKPIFTQIPDSTPATTPTYSAPTPEETWAIDTPTELSDTLRTLRYDPAYGTELAEDAEAHASRLRGSCGKYVREAIERQGDDLGGAGGYSWLMPDKLLAAGWMELEYDGDPNDLPDGVVQIYAPGEAGYHQRWGHLQILRRRGDKVVGISDGTIQNVKKGGRYFIKPKTHMSSTMA